MNSIEIFEKYIKHLEQAVVKLEQIKLKDASQIALQEIIDIYKLIKSEDIIKNLERNIASNFLMMRKTYNCHWLNDYIHTILFYNGEVSKQTEAIIEYLKAEISYLNEQKECMQ